MHFHALSWTLKNTCLFLLTIKKKLKGSQTHIGKLMKLCSNKILGTEIGSKIVCIFSIIIILFKSNSLLVSAPDIRKWCWKLAWERVLRHRWLRLILGMPPAQLRGPGLSSSFSMLQIQLPAKEPEDSRGQPKHTGSLRVPGSQLSPGPALFIAVIWRMEDLSHSLVLLLFK